MPLVRRTESRRTETPNAVMTTLASPTQGGAGYAMWRVDMRPGQAGPPHAVDAEQVWTVLDGAATLDVDGAPLAVGPGDTVVIPTGVPRRVAADATAGLTAIVVAAAGMRAHRLDATDTDGVVPAWVA